MELEVFGKNLEVSEAIQDYARKKVGRLARYLPRLGEAKVEICEEKTDMETFKKQSLLIDLFLSRSGKLHSGFMQYLRQPISLSMLTCRAAQTLLFCNPWWYRLLNYGKLRRMRG